MVNPISTYRIQFHRDFNFEDFEKIIPYLQKLGVSTIYASPVFTSTPGSTHGYDGINPHQINPEVGTEEQLKEISRRLKSLNLNWLQDIVPNHMAFHPDNPWLMDVLEKGRQSVYASFFDIDWESRLYNGKLLVPFLGASFEDVVNNELKVEYKGNRFVFNYYDSLYPLNLRSYAAILKSQPTDMQDVRQLLEQLEIIHRVEDPAVLTQQWNEFLLQFSSLMKEEEVKAFVDTCLATINNNKAQLEKLVDIQFYHLSYWKETDKKINFRRFFTVNGLICLNIQSESVFTYYHTYIKTLLEQGVFNGLRIDHIDGLYDPGLYLHQLRQLAGDDTYLVVEKILEPEEKLKDDWPIQGSTGYDFLSMVNNLFTDRAGEKAFTKFYRKLVGDRRSVHDQILEKKGLILHQHMAGELENLYQLFIDLNLAEEDGVNENLKSAIAEFLILCPVYRYYGNSFPLKGAEADAVQTILNNIRGRKPALSPAVDILEKTLLIKPQKGDKQYNSKALKFYQRCMQFTGPLMAKGVEDTLMYTYNRFIGHNEVGDSPDSFGFSVDKFHWLMKDRQQKWPLSINGTSTHDTKRGEDVRTRLNVLTEISEGWIENVKQWQFLNKDISDQCGLSANDEYFIYQTIVGTLPMPGQDEAEFESRVHEYLIKALREAKQHSNWASPNEEYETAAKTFASALLNNDKPFHRILQKFNSRIADFGIINSLSQVLLKFTCPGVPDVYQGCELWDLSLVDPDNRRAVDYNKRLELPENLNSSEIEQLWENRYNGQIKLWLTSFLLKTRQENSEFFANADYIPLKVKGKYKEHVLAFARKFKSQWFIIAVPLHLAKLSKVQKLSLSELKWKNTRIVLNDNAPDEFENLISNNKAEAGKAIFIKDIFSTLPLAVLKLQQPVSNRGAGILLHITSLPSPFGIGDLGPGAKNLADYLSISRQKYWQILPLGPTEEGQGYSPYSAISSMAGNTLLISPELLAEDGLLEKKLLKKYRLKNKSKVDFSSARQIKNKLLDEAYHNFCNSDDSSLHAKFDTFCEEEADWLDDFSLYLALKQFYHGRPWYEWPEEHKLRDPQALEQFSKDYEDQVTKTKWLQFVFMRQWNSLKEYCNKLNIHLFGDLPFYVSNDSSDVWANKEIFCLDEEGRMTNVAGVPPDYFNDNGQLWGMPLFKWDVLKNRNYDWWVKRIKRNMQLYDLLRLDHFRAFSSYWDVPAHEETAKNGEWKPGPGSDFFRVLKQELGELPFVAEDLGDIDQPVFDLRDEFALPGMQVLQFAFGDDSPQSVHVPHNSNPNSIVYTGTHDNNTTLGWYKQDVTEINIKNLEDYSGMKIKKENIHLALSKLAYLTTARIVILPMQDVLGLDEGARMNIPASASKNWEWRLTSSQINKKDAERLRKWVRLYNRE